MWLDHKADVYNDEGTSFNLTPLYSQRNYFGLTISTETMKFFGFMSKVKTTVKNNGLSVLLDALNGASSAADMVSLPPLKLACEAAIQIIQIVQVSRVYILSDSISDNEQRQ